MAILYVARYKDEKNPSNDEMIGSSFDVEEANKLLEQEHTFWATASEFRTTKVPEGRNFRSRYTLEQIQVSNIEILSAAKKLRQDANTTARHVTTGMLNARTG